MGRQQGNNTLNYTMSNIAPPKASGFTTARFEHANTDETEENDLKK